MTEAESLLPRHQEAELVAIIGMAGRFPGAPDVDSLWRLLRNKVHAITEIPKQRYDVDALYAPDTGGHGHTVSRWGGFLERIDEFDAEFFGIPAREAASMDPQQSLLLESAYEALEDAGQTLGRIAGSVTGTFVGQRGGDYWVLQHRHTERLNPHAVAGAASHAVTSGRLAYAFDLRGPSLTVDTACSSSLVAVHLAVQSLRSGECEMALVGGVNLVLLPEEDVFYADAGMLASDGRCKFGDATADGFVHSDGVGMVVLKPLAQALEDGDRVRAVIVGSAVGNGGACGGPLARPGMDGQRRVLASAYRSAGIDPAEVDYVEANGTGTSVGDLVELQALGAVLGAGRAEDHPCIVGSIKTNIGHADSAAGVAGLIKAVLCLERGMIPASLHLNNPNPAVRWSALPLRIPQDAMPLTNRGRPAIAGVSSFGLSGTNAHVVLRAHQPAEQGAGGPPGGDAEHPAGVPQPRAEILTVSAATVEALGALAESYADFLSDTGPGRSLALRDICHSAAVRRHHHNSRLAVVACSHDDAVTALRAFARGKPAPGLAAATAMAAARPRLAFVFSGQGSQRPGMARELLDSEPVFAAAMQECDDAIRKETGWSVIDLLCGPDTKKRLAVVDVVQPTLWAVEVALAAVWRSWGVEPDVVIGHSMGEAAAAYVAGALSLADAASVICRRSQLAARLSGRGAMAWTKLSAEDAAAVVAPHIDHVSIAAANGPAATLLSGDPEILGQIMAKLYERGIYNRRVNVDFASHSPQMDQIRDSLVSALADLRPRAGKVPMHSTLLGEAVDGSGLDAQYWARNIREPVEFAGVIRQQLAAGTRVFVEISPHPVLAGNIRDTAQAYEHTATVVGSLHRDQTERRALLSSLAALHTAGIRVDWPTVTAGGRFVPLPHYRWQRARYRLPDAPHATAARPQRRDSPPLASMKRALVRGRPILPSGR